MPHTAAAVAAFVVGAVVVAATFLSAVVTVVVPRGVPVRLSRVVFLWIRRVFQVRVRFARDYRTIEHTMALYAPVTLVSLPLVWLGLVLAGFTPIMWALGAGSWRESFAASGSSLTTLGFVPLRTVPQQAAAFSEAALGLALLALLITYLPSMYAAFSRREQQVALLQTRAGSPPSAVEMLIRHQRLSSLDRLQDLWSDWQLWFVDVEESHTSLGALALFRSPQPDRNWVTAAGTVLDAASFRASTLELPRSPDAELCLRAGYIALRRIADFYGMAHLTDPGPADPIAIERGEWDDAYDRLAAAGIPLREREQAWRDWAGWRVNYDGVLLSLAAFVLAPPAPWSSDRSPATAFRPPVLRRRIR